MQPADSHILTINGGSSSIKFALFEAAGSLCRILQGEIERIGLPESTLRVSGLKPTDQLSRPLNAPDHAVAVSILMDWIEQRLGCDALTAVGHRLDRFHLVMDAIDRLPQTGDQGIYLKQQLKDNLIEHRHYINQQGRDLPEIHDWQWQG